MLQSPHIVKFLQWNFRCHDSLSSPRVFTHVVAPTSIVLLPGVILPSVNCVFGLYLPRPLNF